MTIAIVGAGMAGLACAEALVRDGHIVTLFDKGRHPGGRMSSRRMATPAGEAGFDYGAQYIAARDPAFLQRVETWAAAGLVARWPAAGDEAWVGTPGMSAPVVDMACRLDVRWSAKVAALVRDEAGWRLEGCDAVTQDKAVFDAVVVAIPAEQVGALVAMHDSRIAAVAAGNPSQPCWTIVACFSERLAIEVDILKSDGVIGWAARDSAKPGRGGGPETWVIQAGPDWSAAHFGADKAMVTSQLLDAFAARAGLASLHPIATYAHSWRYARSGRGGAPCHWNAAQRIGVCGDWCIGPRVEAAWLSGTALAAAIVGDRA